MSLPSAISIFVFVLGIHTSDGCMCDNLHVNTVYCQAGAVLQVTVQEVIQGSNLTEYTVQVYDVYRPEDAYTDLMGLTTIYSSPSESLCGRILEEETMYLIGVTEHEGSYFTGFCSLLLKLNGSPSNPPNVYGLPDCSPVQSQSARRDAQAAEVPDRNTFRPNALFGMPESQAHVEEKKAVAPKHNGAMDTRSSQDAMQLRGLFGLFEPATSEKESAILDKRNEALETRSTEVLRSLLNVFDTLSKKSTDPVARTIVKQTHERKGKALRHLLNDILP